MMKRHEPGHVNWADLGTSDLEKQTAFYEGVFGWTHDDRFDEEGEFLYRMMQLDGRDVCGMAPIPPDLAEQGMPPSWTTYIATADVDATAAHVAELGGTVVMPVMEVPGSGRMALISDPTGAMVGFWEAGDFPGAGVYEEPGSILYSDLDTRDLTAAADFYEALLGWEVDRSGEPDPDYWGVSIDGDREAGLMHMGEGFPPDVPPNWLVYFSSADVPADVKRVEEHGGRLEAPVMELPMAVFAVVSDPEEAPFALMQMTI